MAKNMRLVNAMSQAPQQVIKQTVGELQALKEMKKREDHLRRLADVDAGKIPGKKLDSNGHATLSQHRQQQAMAGALSPAASRAVMDAAIKREKKRNKLKGGDSNG